MLKKIINWFKGLFVSDHTTTLKVLPPIVFAETIFIEKALKNEEVIKNKFYVISSGKNLKWALFHCPCNCGYIVTLSLQRAHNPKWRLNIDENSLPTLYPSIWQKVGCYSHFWLKEGRVYWCKDAGKVPTHLY